MKKTFAQRMYEGDIESIDLDENLQWYCPKCETANEEDERDHLATCKQCRETFEVNEE